MTDGVRSTVKQVLFVDDDEQVLRLLERLARRQQIDCELTFVVGGAAAIELLARRRFDIVVTDLDMPPSTGFDVLAAAKQYSPEAFRILLTGSGIDSAMVDAHAVVSKSGARDELWKLLRRLAANT